MYTHAQLDSNNVCFGYGNLTDIEDHPTLVYLPNGWDEDLLWRKYENGVWSTEKYTVPAANPLDLAKQLKLDELVNARNIALETFTSSALGTPHTYLSRAASIPNDMLLLTSEYSFASGAHYDNQSVPWYSVEDGNTMHTGAEIIQVYLDARASVQTKMLRCGTLIGQVKAIVVSDTVTEAQAVDAVNAIVW